MILPLKIIVATFLWTSLGTAFGAILDPIFGEGGAVYGLLGSAIILVYLYNKLFGKKSRTKKPRYTDGTSRHTDGDSFDDAWESDNLTGRHDETIFRRKVEIDYKDGDGNASRRIVHIRRFYPEYGPCTAILAQCEMRDMSHRTFLTNRISRLVDLETGNQSRNADRWIKQEFEKTALGKWQHGIRVLTFIAQADGRVTHEERASIQRLITKEKNSLPHDAESIDEFLTFTLKREQLTPRDFEKSLNLTARYPQEMRSAILDAAKELHAHRKSPHKLHNTAYAMVEEKLID